MKRTIASLLAVAFTAAVLGSPAASQALTTKRIASGLSKPLWAGSPEGDDRIFILEQRGLVKLWKNGAVTGTFLSIGTKLSNGNEQGLLGMAFHPNFANNGSFYLNYTDVNGDTVVSRWQVSPGNPDLADPASEFVIFAEPQPFSNHNAGAICFGPDGYFYIAMGDGGSGNDPACRAQDHRTVLGKILRIDVDGGSPYVIPPGNPLIGIENAREEIWHFGLRNPWRMSFDAATGDLYMGDVGQSAREEISFAPAGVGGLNFGWKVMEGTRCNLTTNCLPIVPGCFDPSFVEPIWELIQGGQNGPEAIIGGPVYRGCAIPALSGTYFFSDNNDDKIRTFRYDSVNNVVNEFMDRTAELAPGSGLTIQDISSFGVDGAGEVLIVEHSDFGNGEVYKVVPAGAPAALAEPRNGSGANAVCYGSLSQPILGNLWRGTIDVSGHPGATFAAVVGYQAPISGVFLAGGEALVDLGSPKLFSVLLPAGTNSVSFAAPIPCDPNLSGATAATQGVILGGGSWELCNAVDFTLGNY